MMGILSHYVIVRLHSWRREDKIRPDLIRVSAGVGKHLGCNIQHSNRTEDIPCCFCRSVCRQFSNPVGILLGSFLPGLEPTSEHPGLVRCGGPRSFISPFVSFGTKTQTLAELAVSSNKQLTERSSAAALKDRNGCHPNHVAGGSGSMPRPPTNPVSPPSRSQWRRQFASHLGNHATVMTNFTSPTTFPTTARPCRSNDATLQYE